MVRNHLTITGLWRDLEREWLRVGHRLRDKVQNEGPQDRLHLEMFRDKVMGAYPKETVDLFLNEYGVLERKVSRASHKKFLPDGSWISNGVRFGP